MAFDPQFEHDEILAHRIEQVFTKEKKLDLYLTNKALYWPYKKMFAVKDPVVTGRLGVYEIQNITISKKGKLLSIIAGGILLLLGIIFLVTILATLEYKLAKICLICLASGAGIMILGPRRRKITVTGQNSRMEWCEPYYFGKKMTDESNNSLSTIERWAQSHNVPFYNNTLPNN